MEIASIIIGKEDYDVVGTTTINRKKYIAYARNDCIYVSEYKETEEALELKKVDEETLNKVLKKLNIKIGE